jgi:hypothetical protein
MKNPIIFSRKLIIIGFILSIIGIIIPWKCSGDISWRCVSGIEYNPYAFQFMINDQILILGLVILLVCLMIFTTKFFSVFRYDLIFTIIAFYVVCSLQNNKIIIDHGGLEAFVSLLLPFWLYYRFRKSNYGSLNGILLTLFIVNILFVLYLITHLTLLEIREANISGGTKIELGLFVNLLGGLINLFSYTKFKFEKISKFF